MIIDTAQILMTGGLMYYTYTLHERQRKDLNKMCTVVRDLTNNITKRLA